MCFEVMIPSALELRKGKKNTLYLCRGGSESHIPQKSGGTWMWTPATCYRDRFKQVLFECESKFPQIFGCHLSGRLSSICNSTKEKETKK